MSQVLSAVRSSRGVKNFAIVGDVISCHHNYISREHHFNKDIIVTRKGAIRADKGMMGIIPGSMGTNTYIVEGMGNKDSFCSAPHDAGRAMSRGAAKDRITLDDHVKATNGVECRKDEGVLDESPAAYKSIEAIIEAARDLVSVKHTLKQVLCVKG